MTADLPRGISGRLGQVTASSVRFGWVMRTLVLVLLAAAVAYVAASFALELVN